MRNRGLGLVFHALIFAFPVLVVVVSPRPLGRSAREIRAGIPVLGAEMVLLGGLVFATRERRKLMELARERAEAAGERPGPGQTKPRPRIGAAGTVAAHPAHASR